MTSVNSRAVSASNSENSEFMAIFSAGNSRSAAVPSPLRRASNGSIPRAHSSEIRSLLSAPDQLNGKIAANNTLAANGHSVLPLSSRAPAKSLTALRKLDHGLASNFMAFEIPMFRRKSSKVNPLTASGVLRPVLLTEERKILRDERLMKQKRLRKVHFHLPKASRTRVGIHPLDPRFEYRILITGTSASKMSIHDSKNFAHRAISVSITSSFFAFYFELVTMVVSYGY